MIDALSLIAARRDRRVHSSDDLHFLANGAADGSIPDYQLAAWLMAAVLNPLSLQETADLTMAMAESGERLNLGALPHPWVDKHSTGGVGDKTTIVLLPLLTSCGLTMVKMSGRGLGITGGTVDKLESIPGFRMDLSPEEMIEQAARIGVAITGQTPRLAPADKALYALRDATGTVRSLPLICSSILSKKIAGGAEVIVIDLKCGGGAFMRTLEEANSLAELMLDVAVRCGVKLRVAITDMDQPLGHAVGNALEVREAVRVLRRESTGRFAELCLALASLALFASGKADSPEHGRDLANDALTSGNALNKMREWFLAQGAEIDVTDGCDWLPAASVDLVLAPQSGFVHAIDAAAIGQAAVDLGGGRKSKADVIDHRVGVELNVEVGSFVESGDPIAVVHAADSASLSAAQSSVAKAIVIGPDRPAERPLIHRMI